tara:strand:- start:525 stop:1313 length:789 start_codon:yes stop_codon:yes gene_type:complete
MPIVTSALSHIFILLPGIIIVYLLLRYDKFPEPKGLLITTILLAFAGTTIFGTVKYDILRIHEWYPTYTDVELSGFNFYFLNFIDAYILVAFGEELVKYLVILLFCIRLKEFNEPLDGLIYGGMAGLGFALEEAFAYIGSAISAVAAADPASAEGTGELISTIMGRWTAIPAHVFFGIVMGSFFSYAIFNRVNKYLFLFLAIFIPTILHGTYDYILFVDLPNILFLFLYAGMLAWAVGLFVHYRGLQKLKSSEAEQKYNLNY